MGEDLASVGKVKQDQATDDRIEGRGVPKCPHVGLGERDVLKAGSEPALLGNVEQPRALIDPYDRASLPDKLRYVKRDVAEASAEIQHPHPSLDSPRRQQLPGRWRQHRRLGI